MKFVIKPFVPYLCLLAGITVLIIRLLLIVSEGTDIAGIEQNVIYSIQVLLDNGKLYSTPSTPPYSITQYTPIYFISAVSPRKLWACNLQISGAFMKLAGRGTCCLISLLHLLFSASAVMYYSYPGIRHISF